jgi:hypothetical protein
MRGYRTWFYGGWGTHRERSCQGTGWAALNSLCGARAGRPRILPKAEYSGVSHAVLWKRGNARGAELPRNWEKVN